MKMTKAMYNIVPNFKAMIELHKKEVENHQKLIDQFSYEAIAEKDMEKRTVYLLEALRNHEHQQGHKKMIKIYQDLL